MRTEVTTWSLEMLSPAELRTAACPSAAVRIERADIPSPELSRFLYTAAGVQRGWDQGAARIRVHTCSLDGPNALANYRARGFRVYHESTDWEDLPDGTPGPWPGAGLPPPSV